MSGVNSGSTPFVDWLLAELKRRDWTREELARRSDTSSSVITNIVSGKAALGVDVARRIAVALEVPQRTVFVIAELMDDEDIGDVKEEEQIRQLNVLLKRIKDDDDRRRTIDILEAVVRRVAESQKPSKQGEGRHSDKPNLAGS